jgi:SAM-dependent methyltransferase
MLNRTRANIAFGIRSWIFDNFGFQSMIERREMNLLEDHMGFRGQIPEHRRFQLDFLKTQGLKPHHSFLEIGCGPMTGGLPLIDYLDAGNYVGVDVRKEVLNLSWQQVGKAGLSAKNPSLIISNAFGNEVLGQRKFDYIMAFSVLFHLSDELLNDWFATVSQRGGTAFANVNDTIDSSTWLQFPFVKRTVDTYRDMAARHGLKTVDFGPIEKLGFKLSGIEKDNPLLSFIKG